jgi:hypothetical protein
MTYTTPRSCFRCGSPWNGYGVICNACKTIETINDQAKKVNEQVTPAPTVVKVEYVPISQNVEKTTYFSDFTTVGNTAIDKSIKRHLDKKKKNKSPRPAKIRRNKGTQKTRLKKPVIPKITDAPLSSNINNINISDIVLCLIALWICSLGNWFIPKVIWLLFKVGIWCMGGFFFMDSPF